MNKEIIKLFKISKKFSNANKDIIVLKNINLKINKGELISLSGPSGSGKSTLVRHLRNRGFVVHDSDEEVSKIYKKPNVEFTNFLKRIGLGDSLLRNKINRLAVDDNEKS